MVRPPFIALLIATIAVAIALPSWQHRRAVGPVTMAEWRPFDPAEAQLRPIRDEDEAKRLAAYWCVHAGLIHSDEPALRELSLSILPLADGSLLALGTGRRDIALRLFRDGAIERLALASGGADARERAIRVCGEEPAAGWGAYDRQTLQWLARWTGCASSDLLPVSADELQRATVQATRQPVGWRVDIVRHAVRNDLARRLDLSDLGALVDATAWATGRDDQATSHGGNAASTSNFN